MRTGGRGVKKSQNFADVIYGWPLKSNISCHEVKTLQKFQINQQWLWVCRTYPVSMLFVKQMWSNYAQKGLSPPRPKWCMRDTYSYAIFNCRPRDETLFIAQTWHMTCTLRVKFLANIHNKKLSLLQNLVLHIILLCRFVQDIKVLIRPAQIQGWAK